MQKFRMTLDGIQCQKPYQVYFLVSIRSIDWSVENSQAYRLSDHERELTVTTKNQHDNYITMCMDSK